MQTKTALLSALIATLIAGVAVASAAISPEPAKPVDPTRYVGRWYEIARFPNKLQTGCDAPTSDWTPTGAGAFAVVQTCHVGSPTGPTKVWRAAGKVLNTGANKIRIGFLGGLIQRDYWIVDRGDDYSWCIMSMPNPKYVWIMSKRPVISAAERTALIQRAHTLGYDTTNLVFDDQPPAA
ncbi:MAG TPA: lipocalin family protein [Caulobacteraceae bacterium]|nr:lipocalin family protein [Caulobacteraceae bacterium]